MYNTRIIKAIPFMLMLLLFLLSAFTSPGPLTAKQENSGRDSIEIFVVSNGVHTDLVLPLHNAQKDWRSLLPEELFNVQGKNYTTIAFGWGNKDFYISTPAWADLTVSTAVKAGLGLGSSAMHVRYLRKNPNVSENCVSLNISKEQYLALVRFVEQSFCLEQNCAKKIDHPGYGDHDLFFEAQGRYTLFRTCNVWTNNALKKAGIKTPVWMPFADGLMHALR